MKTVTRNTGIGNFGKIVGCFHAGKDNAFYYRLFWCDCPGLIRILLRNAIYILHPKNSTFPYSFPYI
jgi:hypothetical protein